MNAIDPGKPAQTLTLFMRQTFRRTGFTDAVIAVSGGVDSATGLFLAVRALGPAHVFPLLLPYGSLSESGTNDAEAAIKVCQIPKQHTRVLDIQSFVDPRFWFVGFKPGETG
ncbi:hypothetical protein M1555_04220 [Patescibacteria group bacterium]|nr:hypothetical protein [Patescibacteria group bacterium]